MVLALPCLPLSTDKLIPGRQEVKETEALLFSSKLSFRSFFFLLYFAIVVPTIAYDFGDGFPNSELVDDVRNGGPSTPVLVLYYGPSWGVDNYCVHFICGNTSDKMCHFHDSLYLALKVMIILSLYFYGVHQKK